MTPEERAEALVVSPAGVDAIRHCDACAVENLIAAAIREAVAAERERIAATLTRESRQMNMDACDVIEWAVARIREGT
jgi:hypothetical protein